MNPKQFDEAFDKFIESRECEAAHNTLFSIMRLSFMEGWKSAGGEPPPTRPPIVITPNKPSE
ncbi:hypothetical protein LJC60_07470 [Ruminococcaceae bacterium OttesenSCG-928-D13]|nr:hypothetical protein [Ruminococcaceae bacterium OttesenSCG-928-D13]